VREDGTIPQVEKPHWQNLNTFRTQAQTSAGGVVSAAPARQSEPGPAHGLAA
jgi:hypothetical protein